MAKTRFHSDPRREQERIDSSMISNDRTSTANLPQASIQKDWPKSGHYTDSGLNDTIGGIDKQMDTDVSDMKRHEKKGGKY